MRHLHWILGSCFAIALVLLIGSVSRVRLFASPPLPTGRRMPVPPRVQLASWSGTSSGPAALGTVLGTYGRVIPPAQLERMADAVGRAATLESLQLAAQRAGFRARIVPTVLANLAALPFPAIAEEANGEFTVLIAGDGDRFEVFRPHGGARTQVRGTDLAARWTGRVLLVHPASVEVPTSVPVGR